MESPRSPKRRRILASINSIEVSDPAPGSTNSEIPEHSPVYAAADPDVSQRKEEEPRTTKFRFKSSKHRRHRTSSHGDHDSHHRDRDRDRDRDWDRGRDRDMGGSSRNGESDHSKRDKEDEGHEHSSSSHHRRRRRRSRSRSRSRSPAGSSSTRHRHHHHRRRRQHHDSKPTTTTHEPDEQQPDPFAPSPMDPEIAFRESLFDAMADDEGAAYWEGVYGQPIHVYSPNHLTPQGELERMTDDEYAAHVRQKMWEKTHAGLLEERERRKERERAAREEGEESRRVQRELERSLRNGEERRRRRVWREGWEGYVGRWGRWDGKSVGGIPWPVVEVEGATGTGGGQRGREVNPESVRAFFTGGLESDELGEEGFGAMLKDERVRWHPDKMQQRLGGTVEEGVMRDVTAIFQVVDALWNESRKKS